MAQVFISYARDDVGKAKALAAAIERAGFSVWWDRELVGGAEYSREIDDALKSADVVIVLWSAMSVVSAWVRDEAAAGRDRGRLVPARLDNTEVPLGFRQYQTIDLSRWNGRSDSAGVKTLKKAIAAKTGGNQSAGNEGGGGISVEPGNRRLPIRVLLAGMVVFLVLSGLGYLWLAKRGDTGVPSITIVGAPNAPDRARSAAIARDLSIDIDGLRGVSATTFDLREPSSGEVDYVVRVSSVSRDGGAVADLSLMSSASAKVLWTSNFRSDASGGEIRPQAAARLARVLVCLGEAKPASGTRLDDDTATLYLRACEGMEARVGRSVEADLTSLFRQVTERAPRFAPAWANLALLELGSAKTEKQGRQHLQRARDLDPTLGLIYVIQWGLLEPHQWEERISILEEGMRHDPDYATLHGAKSIDLRQVGLLNEAVESSLRAGELNPLSPREQSGLVPILAAAGRIEEAHAQLKKIERLWPGVPVVVNARYAFDLRYGDPAHALALLRRDPSLSVSMIASTPVPNPAIERFLEARIDPTPAKIDAAVEAFLIRWRKDPTSADVASLIALGKVDLAYAVLQNPDTLKSYRSITGVFFRVPLRVFRNDPRFMPLAARLGLVRYWRKTGKWPDFCLDQELPYDCKSEAAKFAA